MFSKIIIIQIILPIRSSVFYICIGSRIHFHRRMAESKKRAYHRGDGSGSRTDWTNIDYYPIGHCPVVSGIRTTISTTFRGAFEQMFRFRTVRSAGRYFLSEKDWGETWLSREAAEPCGYFSGRRHSEDRIRLVVPFPNTKMVRHLRTHIESEPELPGPRMESAGS